MKNIKATYKAKLSEGYRKLELEVFSKVPLAPKELAAVVAEFAQKILNGKVKIEVADEDKEKSH